MQMTARIPAIFSLHRGMYYKYLILLLNLTSLTIALCGLLLSTPALAQIARVLDTKGTALVERSGQVPRLLGAGERLDERDVINVARDSWTILEFNDQTRITLRPGTVFRIDSYNPGAPESMLMGLVKGGFRAVTGLIGKRNPAGVKFHTATATIGIRGTEFDARLCEADCAVEERRLPAMHADPLASARVIEIKGMAFASGADEVSRLLAAGSIVREREGLVLGPDSYAVLAFLDGTIVSLSESSQFVVWDYQYAVGMDRVHLVLIEGHASVVTGAIAKRAPDAFLFEGLAGIVRPRGTSFVMSASGGKGEILVRDGAVERLGDRVIAQGEMMIVDGDGKTTLGKAGGVAAGNAPHADLVKTMPGGQARAAEPGLYVWVRDGAVQMDKGGQSMDVGAGSAGFANADSLVMLDGVPGFMRFDATPRPAPAGTEGTSDAFRAADGSVQDMCSAPGGNAALATRIITATNASVFTNSRFEVGGKFSADPGALGGQRTAGAGSGAEKGFGGMDGRPDDSSVFDSGNKAKPGRMDAGAGSAGPVRGNSFAANRINRNAQAGGGPNLGHGSRGVSNFSGGGRGQDGMFANTNATPTESTTTTTTTTGAMSQGDNAGTATGVAGGVRVGGGPSGRDSSPAVSSVKDIEAAIKGAAAKGEKPARERLPKVIELLRPTEDSLGVGGGAPVAVRGEGERYLRSVARNLGGIIGAAGGSGDGRTDQQETTGTSGIMIRREDQLGGRVEKESGGEVNVDQLLHLDRLVNPGAQ
jgi:hypothetical protein